MTNVTILWAPQRYILQTHNHSLVNELNEIFILLRVPG